MDKSKFVKAGKCGICKRSFKTVPFGSRVRTCRGSIEVCEHCQRDLAMAIMSETVDSVLSLRRDIEDLNDFLNSLAKSETWRKIQREAGRVRPPEKHPENIQKELERLQRKERDFIKKWGKKIKPINKKRQKLHYELEKFKAKINRERKDLLRKSKFAA
ncbi:MAG: hypothetical protein ACE5FW_01700 [Candidatus Aenigmatarchaeota archaeon]